MFFSYQQLSLSIKQLSELHLFFGTTFLALKKASLPVGTTKVIDFPQVIGETLQTYHCFIPDEQRFYTPFKGSNKRKNWNLNQYTNALQQSATSSFSDVLDHREEERWGWTSDYIDILKEDFLATRLIPAFDLAVWLFRASQVDEYIQPTQVIEAFFREFNITYRERTLFDTTSFSLAKSWLHTHAVTAKALLKMVDLPSSSPPTPLNKEVSPRKGVEERITLKRLKLSGIGPAKQIECELGSRLNLIAGDNGLGKTFLLECAWWALTGTWAGTFQVYPRQDVTKGDPSIAFQIGKQDQSNKMQTAKYDWASQQWITTVKRDVLPGLCIFSHADDSFAVWDPAKHPLAGEAQKIAGSLDPLLRFSRSQVWDGIEEEHGGKKRVVCNGLLRDWMTWQTSEKARFKEFSAVIKGLSPDLNEPLIPGQPMRLSGDARSIPTLKFPYGEVPLLFCSSGVQRIIALAYLLVWTWNEHLVTAKQLRRDPQHNIVLLVDDIEAHLHPFWQRTIVPALLNVIQALASGVQTQMVIATHAPLVLASVETFFDEEKDKLFHLHREKSSVALDDVSFVKRGRIDQWLMSEVFGLKHARSKAAEDAIEEAKNLQLKKTPTAEEVRQVSNKLIKTLAPDDDFWHRWLYFAEQRGVML